VRDAAVKSMNTIIRTLSADKICNVIFPSLEANFTDSSYISKISLSHTISEIAPVVGKEYFTERVMPILYQLLNDRCSEVRLAVASNLSKLASTIGDQLLSPSLLNILRTLSMDRKQRVRMAIFEFIGDISMKLGLRAFEASLESIFFQYVTNTAASVRCTGIKKSG